AVQEESMARKPKVQPVATEVAPATQVIPSPSAISPGIFAAAVRQITGQSTGLPTVGSSPYLKFGFEFFKLGSELMNIFGNLALAPFSTETIRRAPKFPGIYVVLRGDT